MENNKYINSQEFVDNVAKRIPVCIVVDCSGSMREFDNTDKSRIDRVNDGINLFYDGVKNNRRARKAVDVMIIQVGNNATVIEDFKNTDENPGKLNYLRERNNLGEGVGLALRKLDERKKVYKKANIKYYQPWLLIMSDGGVNQEYLSQFRSVQEEVRNREMSGKLSVFPIFVQGKPIWDKHQDKYIPIKPETYEERMKLIANCSNDNSRLINIDLNDGKSFEHLFEFLHRSASSVASNNGMINDEKYGNFKETSSVKSEAEDYDFSDVPKEVISINIPTEESDSSKLFEERNREKELIESARKELLNNTSYKSKEVDLPKPEKIIIDMQVNESKVFPMKKIIDGKTILTIQLRDNDRVILIKNNSNKIYDEYFHSDGKYEFYVYDNKIDVKKIENINYSIDKNERIKNINKEIEDTIINITDWDKI